MKYNKSEIMKRAWKMVKEWGINLSDALKRSWKTAKELAKVFVEVINSEVAVGDEVKIEYGDYGNWLTCAVDRIEDRPEQKYSVVYGQTNSGMQVNFCLERIGKILRYRAA